MITGDRLKTHLTEVISKVKELNTLLKDFEEEVGGEAGIPALEKFADEDPEISELFDKFTEVFEELGIV